MMTKMTATAANLIIKVSDYLFSVYINVGIVPHISNTNNNLYFSPSVQEVTNEAANNHDNGITTDAHRKERLFLEGETGNPEDNDVEDEEEDVEKNNKDVEKEEEQDEMMKKRIRKMMMKRRKKMTKKRRKIMKKRRRKMMRKRRRRC